MIVQLGSLLANKIVPATTGAAAAIGARPATANDGVDITSWQSGSFTPRVAVAFIECTVAATLSPPDNTLLATGLELWGYIPALAEWHFIGALRMDGGNVKIVDGTHGFIVEIDDPSPFSKLAIAGATTGGAPTYRLAPMETTR